jgi:hypothetical protein
LGSSYSLTSLPVKTDPSALTTTVSKHWSTSHQEKKIQHKYLTTIFYVSRKYGSHFNSSWHTIVFSKKEAANTDLQVIRKNVLIANIWRIILYATCTVNMVRFFLLLGIIVVFKERSDQCPLF